MLASLICTKRPCEQCMFLDRVTDRTQKGGDNTGEWKIRGATEDEGSLQTVARKGQRAPRVPVPSEDAARRVCAVLN